MTIDHIFIFSGKEGREADELLDFGLVEGSNRMHAGQGTRNRKFYFENFFLEIVWTCNKAEINSAAVKPTGLWQRAGFSTADFSPFGLGIRKGKASDRLFEHALKYQPEYFPPGMTFDVLSNEQNPALPTTFRSPFKGAKNHSSEPMQHPNGIRRLTRAVFFHKESHDCHFLNQFKNNRQISFIQSERNWIRLTFDDGVQGLSRDVESLRLTMDY